MPIRGRTADPILLLAVGGLLALSTVMVFSAAIGTHGGVAEGFKVLLKHLFSIGLALTLGVFAASIPLQFWQRANRWLLGFGALLLILVLIPGIGHEVNGCFWQIILFAMRMRWTRFESASSSPPRSLAFSGRFCCWSRTWAAPR
jgi:cell division protein FtsW (lipid II flippase)